MSGTAPGTSLDNSPKSTPTSTSTSPESSTKGSSPNIDQASKTGRPNKWTTSRQRKLTRLYLYSLLQPKEICEILKEKGDDNKVIWGPRVNSAAKTVNALLDNQPRWLRPKDREEMDRRILALSDRKKQRKLRRNLFGLGLDKPDNNGAPASDVVPIVEFSETPLEDLLSSAPRELVTSALNPPTRPHGPMRKTFTDSVFELLVQESVANQADISSLKLRLPHHSAQHLKSIARLLKTHSVSVATGATFSTPKYCMSVVTTDDTTIHTQKKRRTSTIVNPSYKVALSLPDSVLILDQHMKNQGVCITGLRAHDSKTCWCHVAENLGSKTWVGEYGLLSKMVSDPPRSIFRLDLQFRDIFGNNVLYMLAARGAQIGVIIEVLENGADGNTKNTAGQTFLHVLSISLLRTLAGSPGFLVRFLQKMIKFNIKYHDFDIFGRSFFHMLTHKVRSSPLLSSLILDIPDIKVPLSRDAFGWEVSLEPPKNPDMDISPSAIRYESASPPILDADLLSPDDEIFVLKQARLLETARATFKRRTVEDEDGRNGLQCLAEASLTLSIGNKRVPAGGSNKRKMDQDDPDPSSTRLTLRFELVQKMIVLRVDVNNYDKHGNTVLMAFVSHLKDGEDDRTHAKLLHYLIRSGANIEWRNRQGETALHIAVRLGRKVATKVLLKKKANVHARTAEAIGVLALGEKYYLRARDHPQTYASIHACMALVIRHGAVPAPTFVQEWQ
ncbi:hypothetical protein B0J14DRAFT_485119 [Halenospora varia]|nr:hypothetical protein B0J14DRAFT_485119 [Halenospora varia]